MTDHIHKYQEVDIGVNKEYLVWKCAHPECPKPGHYLRPMLVENRKSICFKCDKEFVLTKALMSRKKPICPYCKEGVSRPDREMIDKILANMKNAS